jgi:hypothetical protein
MKAIKDTGNDREHKTVLKITLFQENQHEAT